MRMARREEHTAPRRYHAARVRWHGPATDTPPQQLILAQATVYADGWARRREDGHGYVGSVQAGPRCDLPAVSGLAEGEP